MRKTKPEAFNQKRLFFLKHRLSEKQAGTGLKGRKIKENVESKS